MKRAAFTLASSVALSIVTTATAFAQSAYPPSPTTSVAGTSGSAGGTAFTGGGTNLSFGTIALAVLLVAGTTALLVARKRAARLVG